MTEKIKINWALKLGSRKFWALLATLVIACLVLFGFDNNTIVNATALVTAFGSVAVYIFTEGAVDKARAQNEPPDNVGGTD